VRQTEYKKIQEQDEHAAREALARKVDEAQLQVDELRAQSRPVPVQKEDSAATDWRGYPGRPGLQMRRRADNTNAFRGRKGGDVSPSFNTLEEAIAWVQNPVKRVA
jgi:hypothetical protein